MGKIVFILGGARSGKSSFAVELAKGRNKKVAFVATCQALDREMKERIKLHIKKRPQNWQTFEEPKNLSFLLKKISRVVDVIIIDCLTLLVSNLSLGGLDDKAIEDKVSEILKVLKSAKAKSIIVSNEVGLGIVPRNRLGRNFRDLAGRINQIVAKQADRVFFMVSGLPLQIKRSRR
ncbi:MAG: bifunctional adenosylcobinamide kinase/adenosylcobinamide-phosphate guanylyltransferase [Omnitrophica bacterium]|nr:bifunctional adenosylcobinamide kinase/adenosylcobinamide-phosphate guanylyltransferase [Candidatus Omnitrophota bacterium]